HLTYTKSYWIDFCKNTLQREIHHNPTKGGNSERKKFNNNYTELHTIYKEMYGNNPPLDIWQDNKTRFTKINFRKVSMDNYWLIKKPSLFTLKLIQLCLLGIVVAISIQASGGAGVGIVMLIGFLIALYSAIKNDGNDKGNSNGGSSGCSTWDNFDSGCSSHGDSGCGSGCSGCSGCGGD